MPLILLIIGLGLIIYNYRAIKREIGVEKNPSGLDISFKNILSNSQEELTDYKFELGILRRDIGESLTELQAEILQIKNDINKLKKNEKIYENKEVLGSNEILDYDDINEENYELSEEESNVSSEEENNIILEDTFDNKNGVISEIDFSEKTDSSKTEKIKKLLENGLTEEQICHELSVSKGEVLLVRGLFKK